MADDVIAEKRNREEGDDTYQEGEVTPARRYAPEVTPPQKTKYRIKTWVFTMMLIVATVFDLLSLIPLGNDIVLVVAGVVFTLWWWKLGLGLINAKKVLTYVIGIIIEVIPGVSWLPGTLVVVIAVFIMSRTEDKLGISITSKFAHKGKLSLSRKKFSSSARRVSAGNSSKILARAKVNKGLSAAGSNKTPALG